MIPYLDQVLKAGISSLKIEGRVKSSYYLATIVRAYRNVLDQILKEGDSYQSDPYWLEEVKKVSHRDFTTGFYFGEARENAQVYTSNSYIRGYDFVGRVLDYDGETGIALVEQRNRIFPEDEVEVFGPKGYHFSQKLGPIQDEDGQDLPVANRAQMLFQMKMEKPVEKGYFLRKRSENHD